ncbi:type 4 pilin-like protein [Microcystis aeruginosa NIES-3806]|uniref:Type 4 pilin-like protein n=1 Tax=Microcystis aeruginosa NIES-3807 TaxID=2517785 RepID=A0AAD3G9Y2_MICAE|nr:type 4 pilin [Microcystis aeruginosa]GCL56159.1 type 4 pilin-like protein [Microcystis aeruginosa NIES-3806]GCL59977.1 type 4 pilin-like protein [Microcystis aeruginosa NIES-3807]
MLEVMIAILTITAFSTGTLQLMAFTALYKVRAERQAQANFWIQEDFEDVKFLASTLDVSSSYVSPDVCTQGYAIALRGQLTNTPIPDRTIFGKNYSLYRTFDITSANPHRLRIDYQVQLATGQIADDYRNQENVIARSSVEVIPDASFKCP